MIGETIGGYKILEVLGRGGMGVVFKAVDTALDKVVALKSLDPVHAQSEQFLGRFRSEARTLGRLQHPHIVNVFAFRHVEPHLFIVMEYVDGGSVADLIAARGAVPWREALPIICQSLEATAYAHRSSVVHRDIKPRNILLTQRGTVKVTDFGLAKIQEPSADGRGLTRTGITGGTLYYMPPEQLEGLSRVDHRGDIYSLGMSCYELLAGRVPFDKQKSEFTILKAIDTHSFLPLEALAPDVPKPLADIVSKALAHAPEDRFQDANAMLKELNAWSEGAAEAKTTLSAPDQETTRVFGWSAPPPTHLDESDLQEEPAPDEQKSHGPPSARRAGDEAREGSRGDSSSLLKSLKLLLKDRSGNWRVSGGSDEDQADELVGTGDDAEPGVQATVLAPAPLKQAPKREREREQRGAPAPKKATSRRSRPSAAPVPPAASRPRRWRRAGLFASLVGALLVAAYLFYPSDPPEADTAGVAASATLSVRTAPDGASVLLDGEAVGTTPLMGVEAPAGAHTLRITMPGFAAFDTTIVLEAGQTPAFTVTLASLSDPDAPAERVVEEPVAEAPTAETGGDEERADDADNTADGVVRGAAAFQSSPAGAEVWINGRRTGTTPFTAEALPVGPHRVEFRKDGFENHVASVRVEAERTVTSAPTLVPLRGTLRVIVRPYGDIYVNGEKKQSESVAPHEEELPVGTHRVRAVHPVLGTWEKNVTLRSGAQREVLFDFRQTYRVTVVSEPRNAAIIVDGEPIGRNTPSQITLRPGRHTVAVRKDGYLMVGQPQTITVERDRVDDALSFQLRER